MVLFWLHFMFVVAFKEWLASLKKMHEQMQGDVSIFLKKYLNNMNLVLLFLKYAAVYLDTFW